MGRYSRPVGAAHQKSGNQDPASWPSSGGYPRARVAVKGGSPHPQMAQVPVEVPGEKPYPMNADEFVRRCPWGFRVGGEMSGLTAHFLFGAKFGAEAVPERLSSKSTPPSRRDPPEGATTWRKFSRAQWLRNRLDSPEKSAAQ